MANCAEYWRRDLAIQWFGKPLPNWYQPCPISVQSGQMGAGGQTTFTFENGEVYGWKMQVQGTVERILDSVVPHEVNHTIFASHFRRPLPRWADEGAATLFEHESEQARQMQLLNRVLNTNKRIPLQDLLAIREYPADMQDVLTLYAEGYSLAGFLVGSKGEDGRRVYIQFLTDAHQMGWEKAIQKHYGFDSVALLEQQWTNWIVAGSPPLQPAGQSLAQAEETPEAPVMLASAEQVEQEVVIRSQSPAEVESIPAMAGIDRAPAALPATTRPLRVVRPQEGDVTSAESGERPARTAAVGAANVRSEDFQVRALRNSGEGTMPRKSTLSPTAGGIEIDPNAKNYQFPEARK
ncbi:peptidase MA family metallohydrolase [Planctomicrobium sp. SH661]|uniref:peptidase MA family metallohydrolase n=1 Tax=Planctomicrobium sp. SH661 TaxID=3448124 RepID=UPI003F5C22B7